MLCYKNYEYEIFICFKEKAWIYVYLPTPVNNMQLMYCKALAFVLRSAIVSFTIR